MALNVAREPVAAAPNGGNEFRIRRIPLQLSAQTANLVVDGAVEPPRVPTPRQIEKLIPREHYPGSLKQSFEKQKLARRQRRHHAGLVHQLAPARVQLPAIEPV